MTGRRLYELITDERMNVIGYHKPFNAWHNQVNALNFDNPPPAWAFLTPQEKSIWGKAAARLKGVRR